MTEGREAYLSGSLLRHMPNPHRAVRIHKHVFRLTIVELQAKLQRRLSFRLSRRAVKSPVHNVREGRSLTLVSKANPQRQRVVPKGTLDVQFGQSLESADLSACVIFSALAACSFRKAGGTVVLTMLVAADFD